jgi:hypothetical protein
MFSGFSARGDDFLKVLMVKLPSSVLVMGTYLFSDYTNPRNMVSSVAINRSSLRLFSARFFSLEVK